MGSKVPAADNTLRILRLLASRKTPTPAAMIATLLELPRSSVYQLLSVMLDQGFITHYPEEKSYGLGIIKRLHPPGTSGSTWGTTNRAAGG